MGKGVKKQKVKKKRREKFSHWQKFRTSAKILHRDAKNLLQLIFCSSSASDFKSLNLVLTRILYAWVDPTNLTLIACKNYKE